MQLFLLNTWLKFFHEDMTKTRHTKNALIAESRKKPPKISRFPPNHRKANKIVHQRPEENRTVFVALRTPEQGRNGGAQRQSFNKTKQNKIKSNDPLRHLGMATVVVHHRGLCYAATGQSVDADVTLEKKMASVPPYAPTRCAALLIKSHIRSTGRPRTLSTDPSTLSTNRRKSGSSNAKPPACALHDGTTTQATRGKKKIGRGRVSGRR